LKLKTLNVEFQAGNGVWFSGSTETLELTALLPLSARTGRPRLTLFVLNPASVFWIKCGTLHFGDVGYDVRPQPVRDDDEGVSSSALSGAVAQSSFAMPGKFAWE